MTSLDERSEKMPATTLAATALFLLWGVIHVIGGGAMLAVLFGDGGTAYLEILATGPLSGSPTLGGDQAATVGVFAFHAWNILWSGLCVSTIAVVLNRRRSKPGYWVNLALVSGADLGLLIFLVLPGIMSWSSAAPGLSLWLPAGITGFLALKPGSVTVEGE